MLVRNSVDLHPLQHSQIVFYPAVERCPLRPAARCSLPRRHRCEMHDAGYDRARAASAGAGCWHFVRLGAAPPVQQGVFSRSHCGLLSTSAIPKLQQLQQFNGAAAPRCKREGLKNFPAAVTLPLVCLQGESNKGRSTSNNMQFSIIQSGIGKFCAAETSCSPKQRASLPPLAACNMPAMRRPTQPSTGVATAAQQQTALGASGAQHRGSCSCAPLGWQSSHPQQAAWRGLQGQHGWGR